MKGTITAAGTNANNWTNKELAFKSARLVHVSRINNAFRDHAEDLDIVMLIFNLLEYNGNYSMAPGSLWNY